MYHVKEAFYSLQGEGARAGRASVFCRFSGCNLWSGREQDRAGAACRFCDTDFIGTDGQHGGRFASAEALADHLVALWPMDSTRAKPYVVFTGGEPLLQLDEALIEAAHARGFEVAVETNGTLPVPAGIDWLCVSPKAATSLVLTHGDELKLVYPQAEAPPERFIDLDFGHFFLQPMDTAPLAAGGHHLDATVAYCLAHPQWRLSLQTHKITGID
ncbi:7-carboxy-7-deazaguanine synthase [Halomonas sp. MCCC 1A17488]|uniref:7-carboxy-7-deazaguanine synthase n=1 Tax=Billgrantia sulfidoxydans TaxID=2733484 RepID=A0ABX7W5B7_9GAMM|nr:MULTISPECIES: 7-carboxy-7-deazaguanine synthase [Halomonas]MCE8015313.1 7-carboxy-7-deazaguanine synthase [Halomonas sp. MCCC 1A17488]MCG3238646.1 7-carboxy-7-deazaguanine synthase [Halomonas sp. MCCC 1A17488]QPP51379.1 7-carboxy-7-deazaguanine synthase [Halomonas sp. SS10-MC5]QTP54930.1 7-carboxy-7-deazaguanine synthase [Halomonas sulfidoxydans]